MQKNANRRGAAVVEYHGKRGRVFRIKFGDADGQQVMETVGAERDGVTRKKAEAELPSGSSVSSGRATAVRSALTFG